MPTKSSKMKCHCGEGFDEIQSSGLSTYNFKTKKLKELSQVDRYKCPNDHVKVKVKKHD